MKQVVRPWREEIQRLEQAEKQLEGGWSSPSLSATCPVAEAEMEDLWPPWVSGEKLLTPQLLKVGEELEWALAVAFPVAADSGRHLNELSGDQAVLG